MVSVSFYWRRTIWDRSKFQAVLPSSIVDMILLLYISSEEPDLICWDSALDRTFHLRIAWEIVCFSRPSVEFFFLLFGSIISLPDFLFFLWQLLHGFFTTDDALCSRGFCVVSQCFCGWAI